MAHNRSLITCGRLPLVVGGYPGGYPEARLGCAQCPPIFPECPRSNATVAGVRAQARCMAVIRTVNGTDFSRFLLRTLARGQGLPGVGWGELDFPTESSPLVKSGCPPLYGILGRYRLPGRGWRFDTDSLGA